VTVTLPASVPLFALSARDRRPLPLLVFTGVTLLIALAGGGVRFPRARYLLPDLLPDLLPAFPLLLPLAVRLTRAPRRHRTLILVSAALHSAYLGVCMALVWTGPP
jgi:hypothetical protein